MQGNCSQVAKQFRVSRSTVRSYADKLEVSRNTFGMREIVRACSRVRSLEQVQDRSKSNGGLDKGHFGLKSNVSLVSFSSYNRARFEVLRLREAN